jgi:type IV secretory pathway TraG/TraD family ATPase VirD4
MARFNHHSQDLIFGTYEEMGSISLSEHEFTLSQDERRRHVYAIGQTGTGKTTLLENLVLQDIYAGRGVTLIDPHGDIASRIANSIPRQRLNDTVYFDAADRDYPIGFNPLSGVDSIHRELVASGIVAGFKGLWANSWGEWLEYLLKNSLMAILEYPGGLSLAALPRFLQDTAFRDHVLQSVTDPEVRRFWENFFGELDQRQELERVSSTLNKAGKLTLSPTLRNILGQRESGIDFRRVMDNGQILIINLSKGLLGADNSNLLGSLLVSHIVHLTMQRAAIPEEQRVDHHLYIDEFQNFTTREFESILSEARKYRLCLTVAHQYLDQIDVGVRRGF